MVVGEGGWAKISFPEDSWLACLALGTPRLRFPYPKQVIQAKSLSVLPSLPSRGHPTVCTAG